MNTKKKEDGFEVEIDRWGKIETLSFNTKIMVGQKVKSNGKFLIPKGEEGIVTKIHRPKQYLEDWADDMIEVSFRNHVSRGGNRRCRVRMRITELL